MTKLANKILNWKLIIFLSEIISGELYYGQPQNFWDN